MEINFTCATCGQPLLIDEASAGAIIDCPKCKASVMVPNTPSETTGVRLAQSLVVEPPRDKKLVRVVVENFDMSIGNMVWFLVKLAVAAIPAAIVLAAIGGVVWLVVMALSGVLFK